MGDQTIESTFNHPFWVEGKGWTFVKDLKVGDLLVQSDGNTLKIESIELEHKQVTVYNMTVDEFHTYFVSDLGIWVHNTNCPALKGDPYHPDSVNARIKPPYKMNPAHDKGSPYYNPNKTPEPVDTKTVYDSAYRGGDTATWYGVNSKGQFYQFFSDNAGTVHFAGIISKEKVPNDVRKLMGIKY